MRSELFPHTRVLYSIIIFREVQCIRIHPVHPETTCRLRDMSYSFHFLMPRVESYIFRYFSATWSFRLGSSFSPPTG